MSSCWNYCRLDLICYYLSTNGCVSILKAANHQSVCLFIEFSCFIVGNVHLDGDWGPKSSQSVGSQVPFSPTYIQDLSSLSFSIRTSLYLYSFVSDMNAHLMVNILIQVIAIRPGLISSLWGIQNIGRNFGIMMYTGTPLFSYICFNICITQRRGQNNMQGSSLLAIDLSSGDYSILLFSAKQFILWRCWHGKI